MDVLFLSDRDDLVMRLTCNYLSQRYDCVYSTDRNAINADPTIIITNHCINAKPGTKIVYYATNPLGEGSDIAARRKAIHWFQGCDVVCTSLSMAKSFLNTFRVQALVQYPYIPEQNNNQVHVVYSDNFNDIEAIRRELGENFSRLNSPSEVANAKVYLAASPLLLDLSLCYAASCGIPVVMQDNINLREFLDIGDVVIPSHMSVSQKIQIIKKSLKECMVKSKSSKFKNASVIEDKIRQALAKKPTTKPLPPPVQQPHRVIGRRQNQVRNDYVPPVAIPPISDSTIYITGSIVGISGYDNLVYEIVRGLKSLDTDVRINRQSNVNYSICPSYFKDIHLPRPLDAWEIIITPPCMIDRIGPTKKSVVFTMWETDHLEPLWVKQLNMAAFVIVPSQWSVDNFKRCGVNVPIYKVPLGYDPLIFNPSPVYPTECVFGTAAALTAGGLRKNTNHIISLFQRAFPSKNDVKLKIKITPSCPFPDCFDSRIQVIKTFLPPMELADWYRSIVTFVNGSYAEGFGLHLIEAMACGRPVISTMYSAVTEYFDDQVGYMVGHDIVPASGGAYSGHWAKPKDEDIIAQMQRVYNDREEAKDKGEASFLRARNFTWKNAGTQLVKLLQDHGIKI